MADENKIVYLPQLKHYDTKIKKYIGDADAAVEQKITALAGKAVQSVEVTGGDMDPLLNASISGTKLTIDDSQISREFATVSANHSNLETRVTAIEGDKTIVKSVEATGATASIADNKLTINVPTPEQYTLPTATETTLGGVYCAVNEGDGVGVLGNIGTVMSVKNEGLRLTGIHNKALTKDMLSDSVQNTLTDAAYAKDTADAAMNGLATKANAADVYAKTETYSQTEVDNKVAAALTSAIVPKGSVAFAALPTPAKANLGFMYNVTDAFTTTDSFVEGAGKVYAAGANVYVVDAGSGAYKFDVFMGFVDLTPYQLKADMPAAATDTDIDAMFA